jgi:hypothetical protein
VYEVLGESPVIPTEVLAVEVEPPDQKMLYEVIVAPPLLAGALQDTVAVVEPVAVAETLCGAPGTAATTAAVELEFAEVLPAMLVAVTTQRIVLPTSAATNWYVAPVAPPMSEPARCH